MSRTTLSLLTVLALSSVLLARPKELNVTLKWNPNEKQAMPLLDSTGGLYAVTMSPVTDKRDKGKQIGENVESKVVVPVFTNSDVAQFVGEHIAGQMNAVGVDVKSGDSGERVLKSELTEVWISEGTRYRGSVRMKITITDSDGRELWSGLVGGSSDNFGRSLKPDNYSESVSDSIQDLAAKLLSAPGFRSAIAKTK